MNRGTRDVESSPCQPSGLTIEPTWKAAVVLTREQAHDLVAAAVADGDGDLVIHRELTLEREWGWLVFYGASDPRALVAGNAPFIVEKSGRLISTGTSHPAEWYLENYEATGDPHQWPGRELSVISVAADAEIARAAVMIYRNSDLSLGQAKRGLSRLPVALTIRTESPIAALWLSEQLAGLGVQAHQIPEFAD